MLRRPWPLGLALTLGWAAAAVAEEARPLDWEFAGGVGRRSLVEKSDSGATLVRETGPLARLELAATLHRAGWPVVAAQASLAAARLDYDGQTQAAQPISATTHHAERQLALRWRPLPPAAWGEAWLGLDWLHVHRSIGSSAAAGGLVETSTLVLPAIRWHSPFWSAGLPATAKLQLQAQWRTSMRHRLAVDYLGVYDESSLQGGRRQEIIFGVSLATSSDWRWTAQWSHTRQRASPQVPIYRAGLAAGTVRQPRIELDDISISVSRSF
jgi:hypothetical protein